MNIAEWLRDLGLERYEQAFRDNQIEADVLPSLTVEDLKDLGVTSVGDRRRLLAAIAALQPKSNKNATAQETEPPTAKAEAARRQVTVMFCDLVGSTELASRLDPEDLREVIGRYHARVAETVRQFDGFVAKYMGDGVLIYFGYPEAHEDDAEQAVRAGLSLVDVVGELSATERLRVRIGIASGLVVVGDLIGAGSAQEQAIVGETPNLAARLQAVAQPNIVVIAESTRRQIGALFEIQDLGPRQLKGFAEPQRAWRVVSENRAVSRFEALRSRTTPLVGREEELELLLRRWAQAKAGSGRVVLISAEPGVGKSRLAEVLAESIATEPHTRLRYFCSPHHQDSALYPVIAQMERAAGFVHGDTPQEKLAKLQTVLAAATPLIEHVALFAELHALPPEGIAPLLDVSPQRRKEKTFEALLRQVEGLSRQQPLLMVFEDIHWLDPSSRELLDRTVERIANWPVLLLATFRPEFQPTWLGEPHVTVLALARLDRRDTAALVLELTRGDSLAPEIVQEIVERTDGVPLFIEEVTKAVVESGPLVAETLASIPQQTLSVPATLHASLIARLDRLGPTARDVAQKAATIGREFSYELIVAIADQPDSKLCEALEQLTNAGLVFARGTPPQAVYLFKHALVRDAVYHSMLKSQRIELHGRTARILEASFPEIVQTEPQTLARHFAAAALPERAIHYWLVAGQQALQRSAHQEAIHQLNAAIASLVNVFDKVARIRLEVDLQAALGFALIAAKGYAAPEVEAAFSRAYELCQAIGEASLEIRVLRGLAVFHWVRGNLLTARRFGLRLIRIAKRTSDDELLLVTHGMLGGILYSMGKLGASERHLGKLQVAYDHQKARRIVTRFGEDTPSTTWCIHAFNVAWLGHLDNAKAVARDAVDSARHTGHPYSLAHALCRAAMCHVILRDPAGALFFAEQAQTSAQELGFPISQTIATVVLGWASALDGRVEEGINRIQGGIAAWQSTGALVVLSFFFALLSEAMLARGDATAATVAAAEGLQRSMQVSEHAWDCLLHCARGDALVASGELAEAEAEYTLASAWSRERSAKWGELYGGIRLARLWRDQGKIADAHDLLAPIYGWFTEGFGAKDLIEARALLDELGAALVVAR